MNLFESSLSYPVHSTRPALSCPSRLLPVERFKPGTAYTPTLCLPGLAAIEHPISVLDGCLKLQLFYYVILRGEFFYHPLGTEDR